MRWFPYCFFHFRAKIIERRRAVELLGHWPRALITEDPARARDMVTDLAGFLRHALDHDLLTRVTLGEELAALDRYLALEHIRFEDRLRVHQEIPSELLRAQLPPMMLQTLVENGLKQGIATLSGGGEIAITAVRQGGYSKSTY
jgi:LytS/YehU family sensor histidine kinase